MPGGQVRDAHGGVRLVHVLAARAAGPVGVDAQVLGTDVHLDGIVENREAEDRGEGGMPPGVRIERRDADQAVDARLCLEVAVGVGAVHLDGHALDPAFGLQDVDDVDGVAAAFGPARVHAQEHGDPVVGLRPARP